MATLAELRERLAALEKLPAGVKQTQDAGQMVTFRGVDDIAKERARLIGEIRSRESGRKGSTMVSSGGLN